MALFGWFFGLFALLLVPTLVADAHGDDWFVIMIFLELLALPVILVAAVLLFGGRS